MRAPTERHLEDWICSNLKRFGVVDQAFDQYPGDEHADDFHWVDEDFFIAPFMDRIICRQITLPHGIPDLIGVGHCGDNITVIELKKGPITLEAVGQCARYMYDLHHILATNLMLSVIPGVTDKEWQHATDPRIGYSLLQGMVVGSETPDRNVAALAELVDIRIVTYAYNADGTYSFTEHTVNRVAKQYGEHYCALDYDVQHELFSAARSVARSLAAWTMQS
jgi:hypothetical protein